MNQDRYLEKNAQVYVISQDELEEKLIETMRTMELDGSFWGLSTKSREKN